MTTDAAYTELSACLRRTHLLDSIGQLLGWDEQVNLPADSADLRAEQLAVLAEIQNAAAANPRTGELLALLEPSDLEADQVAVVRQARRDYEIGRASCRERVYVLV
jgi:carboxypeptidase Taq